MEKDETVKLSDAELAEQHARDLDSRQMERDALDAENRELIHKLNAAMG